MLINIGLYLLLAGLPSVLLLRFFYMRDNRKPEPAGQVIKFFVVGCLITIPAIALEWIIMLFIPRIPIQWQAFYQAFAVAALVEEGLKFLIVRRMVFRMHDFDEITDGFVYTMAAGLGFAFLENVLYGMRSFGSVWLLLLRGFTAVPLHCMVSGLMGYFLGMAWYNRRRTGTAGLLLAILFHGAYDFVLFSPHYSDWLILPILVVGYILVFTLLKKAQAADARAGLS